MHIYFVLLEEAVDADSYNKGLSIYLVKWIKKRKNMVVKFQDDHENVLGTGGPCLLLFLGPKKIVLKVVFPYSIFL